MRTKVKRIRIDDYFILEEQRLISLGKWSTRKNYQNTRRSFQSFLDGQKMWICELDNVRMQQYNDYLEKRHVSRNSKSFYNRILRSVYNRAVREGYALADPSIFAHVYTGIDKTRKKALPAFILRRIIALDLSDREDLSLSRDLFLFSLFSQGMCFIDLAHLTQQNVSGDIISYRRRKTGQQITVQLQPLMAQILERHRKDAWGNYLFPILHTSREPESYKEYVYRLNRYNLHLKQIGELVRCPVPLNSYAARHSWASLARKTGTPVSVISQAMGHSSEKVTQIYLAELDQSVLNAACRKVIDSVYWR